MLASVSSSMLFVLTLMVVPPFTTSCEIRVNNESTCCDGYFRTSSGCLSCSSESHCKSTYKSGVCSPGSEFFFFCRLYCDNCITVSTTNETLKEKLGSAVFPFKPTFTRPFLTAARTTSTTTMVYTPLVNATANTEQTETKRTTDIRTTTTAITATTNLMQTNGGSNSVNNLRTIIWVLVAVAILLGVVSIALIVDRIRKQRQKKRLMKISNLTACGGAKSEVTNRTGPNCSQNKQQTVHNITLPAQPDICPPREFVYPVLTESHPSGSDINVHNREYEMLRDRGTLTYDLPMFYSSLNTSEINHSDYDTVTRDYVNSNRMV